MAITADKAKEIILALYHTPSDNQSIEKCIVYYCELSPNKDYWIIRCNTEKSIVYNQFEYSLIGINAHLVDIETGEIEVVGSGQHLDEYLQDKYDFRKAGNKSYVLIPTFDRHNKTVLIKLKQHLQCSYADIILLFSITVQPGFTSTRRHLQYIQQLLQQKTIQTDIRLIEPPIRAMILDENIWDIKQIPKLLIDYIQFIKNTPRSLD